jgi:predicted RNA-binding protein with PUA-like domain
VELAPVSPLARPVSLETIKGDKILKDMALVKNSRLSVTPLTHSQFARVMGLAETKPAL